MATNKEIIEQVKKDMPIEYAERINNLEGAELLNVFEGYPVIQNSFISTLTNKVSKSLIYSKIYKNQLSELKKGKLEYGESIEELFVQMAQTKGFTANWESSGGANTPEADLIRKLIPKVSALYMNINVDYKSKTTVMDKSLRKAFTTENGLSNLVGQIVGSITSAMEFKEFGLTKQTIKSLIESGKSINYNANAQSTSSEVEINTGATNAPIKQTPYCVNVGTDMKKLSQMIRETTGLMKFPSSKFNLAKELTWSRPEDLILMTTPEHMANLDVNVLASAFNVSMADIKTRTILVDELPTTIFTNQAGTAPVDKQPTVVDGTSNKPKKGVSTPPKAILFDKDLVQIWDTFQGAGIFHNPEGQYTNHFANREGIFATCLFANMAVFY